MGGVRGIPKTGHPKAKSQSICQLVLRLVEDQLEINDLDLYVLKWKAI